jgi:hypothetical protein
MEDVEMHDGKVTRACAMFDSIEFNDFFFGPEFLQLSSRRLIPPAGQLGLGLRRRAN